MSQIFPPRLYQKVSEWSKAVKNFSMAQLIRLWEKAKALNQNAKGSHKDFLQENAGYPTLSLWCNMEKNPT